MEWTAKLDIAVAESDAKRMEAAFDSASTSIEAVSKEITSLFSKDWDDMSWAEFDAVREATTQALKIQKETHDANMKLLDAQTAYEEAKLKRMQSGDALVSIDSSGLEPALETIMWQIIQKVQLKANEDHVQFLLGIQS
jgi:23S rRNA pseudoU1915 N3-methylase RlmH